jgi:NADP-dependent 3-hydroxy acid dehydrogenase YdfG
MANYNAAFVTGASSGIGAALSRRLAAQGIKVGIAARRVDALARLAAEIREAGGAAVPFEREVPDPDAVRRVMRQADEQLGGVDLVVANAGVVKGRWAGKLTYEDCQNMIAVNVAGATATVTALLPSMIKRKRGHIVGISSIAQYRGLPKFAVYSGSKAYVSHMLESMRVDLQGTGVAVTDIRAAYVRTQMTGKASPPFLVEADDAAARIWKAIRDRKKVLTFPLPWALIMRVMSMLPNALYDRASRWLRV